MRILALDPATHCGFAVSSDGQLVSSGTWDLSTRRDESTGMKLLRFESKLLFALEGVSLVVFEAARHAAPKMAGALVHQAKLQAVIERLCASKDVDYRGYSPSEIKKFATGKGNAGKPEVIKAVRSKFAPCVDDDNEADAVALLYLAMSEYGPTAQQTTPLIIDEKDIPF